MVKSLAKVNYRFVGYKAWKVVGKASTQPEWLSPWPRR
jgi:hypothetical protein